MVLGARVWVWLGSVTAFLMAIQYSTLPKIQQAVVAQGAAVDFRGVADNALSRAVAVLPSLLGPLDLLFAAGLGISILGLVIGELTRGQVSAFLQRLEERPRELFAFLILMSVISARYLLNPGDLFLRNAESYGPSAWMVAENLRQWKWPVWSNYWYAGYPLLHYYAPATFVLVALAYLLIGNIHTATKLVLLSCHVGSVILMFLYLREAIRRVLPALVGALAYAFIFYRVNFVLYLSDFILSVVLLIYPALFLIFERYLRGGSVKRTLTGLALTVAALVATHQAYAFFGLLFFGLYAAVRVVLWDAHPHLKLRALGLLAVCAGSGMLVGGFSLLPFALEGADVRGMASMPFDHLVPRPPLLGLLRQLLTWAPTGLATATMAYIGVSLVALSLVAVSYFIRTKHSVGLALVVSGVYALFTVRGGTYYNTKNLTFFVFYLCAVGAFAPVALAYWCRRAAWMVSRQRQRPGAVERSLALACSALLLLDFGPMTFQQTFMRNRYGFQEAMYATILRKDPSARVLERRVIKYDPTRSLAQNFETDRLGIISAYAPIHTPLGRFHEGAALSIGYFSEMIKQIDLDLNQERLSPTAIESLYLMNVKFLTFRDRDHYFPPPIAPTDDYVIEDSLLVIRPTRPLLASRQLSHVDDMAGYDAGNAIENRRYFDREMNDYTMPNYDAIITPLLHEMRIDVHKGIAERLIVRGPRPPAIASDPARDLRIAVGDVDVTIDSARIAYDASSEAYGQVAFSFFPYLDVRVDGNPVSFYRSAMHTIIVPLPAGSHVITIGGQASPTRKSTFAFSLVALAAVVLVPRRWLRAFEASSKRN